MKRKPLIKTDDLARLATRFKPSAQAPTGDTGSRADSGPTLKTNIVLPREIYGRVFEVLRTRQQEAFKRNAKRPRGISELIVDALKLWLAAGAPAASGPLASQPHRSNQP